MARLRTTYLAEFKLRAVKMIADQKLSVVEVARRSSILVLENCGDCERYDTSSYGIWRCNSLTMTERLPRFAIRPDG